MSKFTPNFMRSTPASGNPYGRGRVSTVDLLVITASAEVLFMLKLYFSVLQTSYLNEEVNCVELSSSVSVSCLLESKTSKKEKLPTS